MASMLIQAATVVLTTVGVPTGAATAISAIGVNLALTAATNYATNYVAGAGKERAEPSPTAFRLDTNAGLPFAFGRCPPSAILEFAR